MKIYDMKTIREFVFDQRCIPYCFSNKVTNQFKYFVCRFGIAKFSKYKCDSKEKEVKCTFLIPHKDCAKFLKLCVNSIQQNAKSISYEIIIADDASSEQEFLQVLELLQPGITIYRFANKHGHPFVLEWLYSRARSQYVVILDQDAMLVSRYWENLFHEFDVSAQLLLIGVRDQYVIRWSPQMVHPSFLLINKKRISTALKGPFFFGDKPFYEKYQIGYPESYHALSCKALAFHSDSIRYLESYKTKYGFGSVAYHQSIENLIIYHQWYSGRINSLEDSQVIDGFSVRTLRDGLNNFFDDHSSGKLNFEPV